MSSTRKRWSLLMISASEKETFVCRSTRLFWRTRQVDLLRSRIFYSRVMFRSLPRYSSIPSRLLHTVTRQDNVEKKKVIVLGAGWYVRRVRIFRCSIWHFRGGFQFVRYLNRKKYDVTLVSCSAESCGRHHTLHTLEILHSQFRIQQRTTL